MIIIVFSDKLCRSTFVVFIWKTYIKYDIEDTQWLFKVSKQKYGKQFLLYTNNSIIVRHKAQFAFSCTDYLIWTEKQCFLNKPVYPHIYQFNYANFKHFSGKIVFDNELKTVLQFWQSHCQLIGGVGVLIAIVKILLKKFNKLLHNLFQRDSFWHIWVQCHKLIVCIDYFIRT